MGKKRKKLIEVREKAGLSQEGMAAALCVSRSTVANWENGRQTPYPHQRAMLCEYFGVDSEELLRVFEDTTAEILWYPSSTAQDFIAKSPARLFWQIAHTDYPTPDELTVAISAAIKDMTMMTGDSVTRREALCELASIPLMSMGTTQTLHTNRYEELLRYCAAALQGCWELYRDSDPGGSQHAFECASTYIPLLKTIAHDSSKLRKEALDLAARYALLQTVLGWGCIGARETIGYAQHALFLSRENGNILLQVSACSKLGWTYTQCSQYVDAHNTMQEGEHALKTYQRRGKGPTLPAGVIGNFYSSYALAQTDNGIDPDRALDIATDSEPLKVTVALIKFTTTDQSWEAARICSAKGDPRQAIKWLAKLIDPEKLTLRPVDPQLNDGRQLSPRGQVGAINTLTDALLQLENRDMRQVIHAWSTAIKGAKALKSEQNYRDAMTNFASIRTLWRGEDAIKRLMPLTSHW